MDNSTKNSNTFLERIRSHKGWILIIVVAVICICAILFLHTNKPTPAVKFAAKPTPSVGKKVYTDPLYDFKITIPGNWVTQQGQGTGITGQHTAHPVTQQVEVSQLYIPPEEGITIQVYTGVPTCPLETTLTTTLAGFPASYDSTMQTWTIPTTKATLVISLSYPGGRMFRLPPSQAGATPIPSVVAQQNEAYVMNVLKTLKLTNLTPFSCQ